MSESDVGTPLNTGKSEAADRTELRGELARSLAQGGMSGVQVISWETAQEVLTPKRREVVEILGQMSPNSVRELSRELDRDKAQVSRDLEISPPSQSTASFGTKRMARRRSLDSRRSI
jgi:hypothetical protein